MRNNPSYILRRLGLSVVLAVVLTLVSCLAYTAAREWLLRAISSHAIAFLENFDLIAKIQEKVHTDTIPTIWQLQAMFFQIGKLFIFFLGLSVLLLFMPLKEWRSQHRLYLLPRISKFCQLCQRLSTWLAAVHKGWLAVLVLLAALQFALCWTIVYHSWWSGDDFYCTLNTGQPFLVRFLRWVWCSSIHVARGGELFFYLFPLTPDRWVHLLLTPTFFALFPWAVKRLVLPQLQLCSLRGVLFYLTAACLIYMGARFTTYCCFSACANYIYGTIFAMFVIPYYVYGVDRTKDHSWLTIFLFGLCTFLLGVSTEGIAVIFICLLFGQLLWRYVKGQPLPPLYYISLITFWMGACWLLFMPGAAVRGMNTPFTGGIVPYNFYGMPLLTKLSYLPELFAVIWRVCHVALICYLLTVLVWLYAYLRSGRSALLLRPLLVSLGILGLSLLTAVVYIGGCIPNGSTFTPCSFGIISALLYLLYTLYDDHISWLYPGLVVVALIVLCVRLIVPNLSYSIYLKPFELQRNARIQQQIAAGQDTIRLPYPYPADYDSTRTDIPHAVKISEMAVYFNVKAIIEEGKK
jgi:hypothetical protein